MDMLLTQFTINRQSVSKTKKNMYLTSINAFNAIY